MATLTNTKIKDTYVGLLKTTDNQAIDAAGVTLIEDGLGNASALSVGRSGNGVTITGSLNATLATAAQTNITSVGTLSSLAVSGNLTVDTNTLFVDAASNNVGIRTSSPQDIFQVNGFIRVKAGTPRIRLEEDDVTNQNFEIRSNAGELIIDKIDDDFSSNRTERLRIDSSGNVSIASGILELAAQAKIIGSSDNLKISADPDNVSGGSTIEFLVDGSEKMRIDSSGNVGIGTSSPSVKFEVNSGTVNEVALFESTDQGATVTIKDNTAKTELSHSGDNFSIQVDPDNTGAASSFIINMDGTEKLRMHPQYLRLASGTGGIQFNGDTAAANALDDYEEGSWSPVYVPTSGSFATMTMDILNANYTKIGRLVTIVAQIRTDDVDVTGGSGNVLISGLPYTAVSSSGGGGAISVGFTSDFVNAPTAGGFTNNGTTIVLRVGTTAMAVANLTDGTSANENTLYFAASYFTS
jgi:hypothetical protein